MRNATATPAEPARTHTPSSTAAIPPASMTFTDKAVGTFLIAAAAVIWGYYTCWVFITVRVPDLLSRPRPRLSPRPPQPFFDDAAPLQALFPDRWYAIAGPAAILATLVSLLTAFVGVTTARSAAAKAKKA